MKQDQQVDYGSIQIHKKVLADIVLSVVHEAEGIAVASESFMGGLLNIFRKRNYSGIIVTIDKDNEVSIEVRICVQYGVNIPDASRQLQDAIRDAIEKTTDINLKDVHINIQGIEGGA
ncbi:MAG: Asp23/Gls24 family envelope stress response protein [Candidatus Omnitrophica bacterium]|nr:Asp23/Gls24 family envelope stress response protein [Candidatus Omnitrophota bacterium]